MGQPTNNPPARQGEPPVEFDFPPPGFDPGFAGPPPFFGGPPGGPGGLMREEIKLVKKFDRNGDGWLNEAERKAAREFLARQANTRGPRRPRGPGGPGGPPGGFGQRESQPAPQPGPKVAPGDVKTFPGEPLYASNVLRTLFLDFAAADWEKELEDFHGTDVEVPARLTVDGRTYPDVGVHFRGASSYMMVGTGRKRSLSLLLDFLRAEQNLGGYRTLHLLNSHEDPSFLRTVLSCEIGRAYLPAPKANLVRLVINGESWGVYVNEQQFNKDFVRDWFGGKKGARWKVPGSPGGRGSLAYLGDDPADYRRTYEIKSKDDPRSWADLIKLCKALHEVAPEQVESALGALLDLDGALRFLALENALINNDGYWVRTSDYNLYQDERGRFHILPFDMNETFSLPGGPGFGPGPGGPGFGRGPGGPPGFGPGMMPGRGTNGPPFEPQFGRGPGAFMPGAGFGGPPWRGPGPGGPGGPGFGGGARINGVELDPLLAAKDANKPLISKLLAVPALRARYLGYVRDIAEKWLDWNQLGPRARQYHDLIADEVKADTRKLASFEAFEQSLAGETPAMGLRGPERGISLKSFADQRRAYLLNYPEIKALAR
jgi:hypothetical protein